MNEEVEKSYELTRKGIRYFCEVNDVEFRENESDEENRLRLAAKVIPGLNKLEKLKPCPCGKDPEKLVISHSGDGCKWAWVGGYCCGEWNIEFRTNYKQLDSDECMELAMAAWNRAERG